MNHGHSSWKPLMTELKHISGERGKEARKSRKRASLWELKRGKSAPQICSGLTLDPFHQIYL